MCEWVNTKQLAVHIKRENIPFALSVETKFNGNVAV